MTFQPEADKPKTEVRCPLGFTVRLARPVDHDCGYNTCHPEACGHLRRLGIELKCENWENTND
jgi:hypothetical protein